MNSTFLFGIFLRLLPSVAILVMAFIAGADRGTREQWTKMLYQAGSLRPEQRDDPKIQSRVRIPFFIVAAVFLIWPIRYYFHATTTVQINPAAYGSANRSSAPVANPTSDTQSTANAVNTANAASASNATSAPGATPAASATKPAAPAPAFNPYGTAAR